MRSNIPVKSSRIPKKSMATENTTKTQNLTQVSQTSKPKTSKKKSENSAPSKQEIVTRIQEMMATITEDNFKLDPAKLDSKTYIQILNTIFSCFPIDLKQDKVNHAFIKEFFTYIGCPYQVSQTHLQTIGNPQTFVNIMAPLVWFYDLLKLYQTGDEYPQDQETSYAETNFNNLLEFYQEFMSLPDDSGDNELKSRIAQSFAQIYSSGIESCQDKIEDYQNQINFAKQTMEQMDQRVKILNEKQNNISKLEQELAMLFKETQNLESICSTNDLELGKLQMELDRSQKEYTDVMQKRNSVKQRVSDLNVDTNKVEQIQREIESIKKQVDAETQKHNDIKKETSDLQDELNGINEAYNLFIPFFSENLPPNQKLPDSHDKENRLRLANSVIEALKEELRQDDPNLVEAKLQMELKDILDEVESLESDRTTLQKDVTTQKPNKSVENTETLNDKLKDLENVYKQFQMQRDKEMGEAKEKYEKAVESFNAYKSEVESTFGTILRDIEMTIANI